ncbi:MAG TPA: hypothetical protein VIY26_16960 [Acidimicrobiales bacterium]
MPLVIISIPLMILAVGAAAIPLLVLSHRDHGARLESGEQREHALALIEARQNAANVQNVDPADSISEDTELPVAA